MNTQKKPVDTIAIRNPQITKLVAEHQGLGVGRSAVETAENLIHNGVEYLRGKKVVKRAPRGGKRATAGV